MPRQKSQLLGLGTHHGVIALEQPQGGIVQEDVDDIAVRGGRGEARLIAHVRRVAIARVGQVKHPVGQIVARLVRQVPPHPPGVGAVEVPGGDPAGAEAEHQRHGRQLRAQKTCQARRVRRRG
jgi:hypothetical protein